MSYPVKQQFRDIAAYGVKPYGQVHSHSTGNGGSTAQNEADYMSRKNLAEGYYTEVVGDGGVIETAYRNRGAWDVGNRFNFETYAGLELIESHKTQADFLVDYAIYIDRLRSHAKEGGIPLTLDSADNRGIKTHEWCTIQANTYGGHVDPYPYLAKRGITRERFRKDVENGMTIERVETYENPVKGALDVVNVNSQAFQVKGWLLNKKVDLRKTVPWIFFVNEENKELGRVKGVWNSRSDVMKAFPNSSQDMVGVIFNGETPEKLTGDGKYRIMIRASDDKGNLSLTENWFDSDFSKNPKVDTGFLDTLKLENGKLRIQGWHLASNQDVSNKHFILFMNRDTNTEVARIDITKQSYTPSTDIKKVFPNNQLLQASKCRFDALVETPAELKGKNIYVMSRYCTDEKGNNGVKGQYSFKDSVIFI